MIKLDLKNACGPFDAWLLIMPTFLLWAFQCLTSSGDTCPCTEAADADESIDTSSKDSDLEEPVPKAAKSCIGI